jgi:hypothetical protein
MWSKGWPFHAQRRLRGFRLVATDADPSVGDGPIIEGRVSDLLLLATGRIAAAGSTRLWGPGVALLVA